MKHRVVKVRLYPNSQQKTALAKAFGCTRWLWNNSLNETNRVFKETSKGLSAATMKARIVELKKEYPWLTEVYSQVLQSAVLNLSQAFVNFFQKRTKYPRFKSKHSKQSIQYPQHVKLLNKRLSKGMVKNHNLAKAISDCSWSTFVGMLKYKCEREGKVLMQVDRFFPSSKTCNQCLYQIGEMPLDIRAWTCPSCGTHHDRDINAAKNIVAEALKLLASGTGATASGGSVRPKPGCKSSVAATPRETGRHASISQK